MSDGIISTTFHHSVLLYINWYPVV